MCTLSVCSSGSSYNELLLILMKEILTHFIGIQELLKALVPSDVLLDWKQPNQGLGASATLKCNM